MHNYGSDEFFYKSVLGRDCIDYMNMEQDYDFYLQHDLIDNPIECGAGFSSFVFYLSFNFLVFMISLNLFIAVIFEAFL